MMMMKTTTRDEDRRQSRILKALEEQHFAAFAHEKAATPGSKPIEFVARRPARTPGCREALLVCPLALGLGVAELPAGDRPAEAAAAALRIDPGATAGICRAEQEIDQVWMRAQPPEIGATCERAFGWLSRDAWVPVETPEALAAIIEAIPKLPAVDFRQLAKQTGRGQPDEAAFGRLEAMLAAGTEPPPPDVLEAAARAAVRARRAQQRMDRRLRREVLQGAGPRQR